MIFDTSSTGALLKFCAGSYRLLLAAYPAAFRFRYADEMMQVFEDLLQYEAQQKGRMSVMRLWLRSLIDLWVTAFVERKRSMTSLKKGHEIG